MLYKIIIQKYEVTLEKNEVVKYAIYVSGSC